MILGWMQRKGEQGEYFADRSGKKNKIETDT